MNNLEAVSIKTLNDNCCEFIIPKLQRGYRWYDRQIKELLCDLSTFFKNHTDSESYYCLQPLIVNKIGDSNGKEIYSVIDGQQRLVTTFLFAYYLFSEENDYEQYIKRAERVAYNGEKQCKIYYENEKKYVSDMLACDGNATLTERFISESYAFIKDELSNIDYSEIRNTNSLDSVNKILDRIKFIYYELSDKSEEVEIFTNVNVGKIPLNNAEKIKGLMFKSDNFITQSKNKDEIEYTKNELMAHKEMIVDEWSEIEYHLHDEDFFSFFTQTYSEKIRINFLFDIFAKTITKKEDISTVDTFFEIENYLKEKPIINKDKLREFWMKIKEIYYTLLSWYKNDMIYHYIGYLIYFSKDYNVLLISLYKAYSTMNKDEFINYLISMIKIDLKESMGEKNLEKLRYIDENDSIIDQLAIRKILLLFNIENIIQNFRYNNIKYIENNSLLNERFSFKRFKSCDYQLEHIHSQSDSIVDKIEWLLTLYLYKDTLMDINIKDDLKIIKQNKLIKTLDLIAQNYKNIEGKSYEVKKKVINGILKEVYYPESDIEDIINKEDMINEIIDNIICLYTDDDTDNYKHSISNLTLLDSKTNASYGNKIFPLKVSIIKDINTTTRFIPVATRNAMLKYYTDNPEHNLCWNKKDMDSYICKIKLYLEQYL